jgi:hypothetical protein
MKRIAAKRTSVTITIDSFDYTLWEERNDLRVAH